MSLTLNDYLNPEKFPMTTQKDLSPSQQFRIDAFNYDSLIQYLDEGGTLDQKQQAILKELEVKIPAQKALKSEI
ncbi:MAG: hypothetical protein VKL20_02450 [Synechocystis sp.]|nr:hypothetical protein [Synechocystis sp.]